jgi:hypothetical protein
LIEVQRVDAVEVVTVVVVVAVEEGEEAVAENKVGAVVGAASVGVAEEVLRVLSLALPIRWLLQLPST